MRRRPLGADEAGQGAAVVLLAGDGGGRVPPRLDHVPQRRPRLHGHDQPVALVDRRAVRVGQRADQELVLQLLVPLEPSRGEDHGAGGERDLAVRRPRPSPRSPLATLALEAPGPGSEPDLDPAVQATLEQGGDEGLAAGDESLLHPVGHERPCRVRSGK